MRRWHGAFKPNTNRRNPARENVRIGVNPGPTTLCRGYGEAAPEMGTWAVRIVIGASGKGGYRADAHPGICGWSVERAGHAAGQRRMTDADGPARGPQRLGRNTNAYEIGSLAGRRRRRGAAARALGSPG